MEVRLKELLADLLDCESFHSIDYYRAYCKPDTLFNARVRLMAITCQLNRIDTREVSEVFRAAVNAEQSNIQRCIELIDAVLE